MNLFFLPSYGWFEPSEVIKGWFSKIKREIFQQRLQNISGFRLKTNDKGREQTVHAYLLKSFLYKTGGNLRSMIVEL